jgi:hypothetical protein
LDPLHLATSPDLGEEPLALSQEVMLEQLEPPIKKIFRQIKQKKQTILKLNLVLGKAIAVLSFQKEQ